MDVIPPDQPAPPPSPPKMQNKFKSLIFRKKSQDSASKLAKKLSAVGIVEELFEEGSAMLAERLVRLTLIHGTPILFLKNRFIYSLCYYLKKVMLKKYGCAWVGRVQFHCQVWNVQQIWEPLLLKGT